VKFTSHVAQGQFVGTYKSDK